MEKQTTICKEKRCHLLPPSSRLCCILCWSAVVLWTLCSVYYMFPEAQLVLYSKCSNPVRNWDGKILGCRIWRKINEGQPKYFNLHFENEYNGSDSNHRVELMQGAGSKRPVVIFGTHHKTGTFLAKKLFAKICSRMMWCCLFHVTRESIHSIKDALQLEPVNALGHNQWIWYPNALGIRDYRFIHFYRDPFRKIISGYRYHADGIEEWTKKPLSFDRICSSPLLQSNSSDSPLSNSSALLAQSSMRTAVWEYCSYIHLCETCCRMAHEVPVLMREDRQEQYNISIETTLRSNYEYQFMCDNLGQATVDHRLGVVNHSPSLQEKLKVYPPRRSILTEAALDYYESLRMAQILNHTADDPRTLNIDLDDMTAHYSKMTWQILHHLKDVIPSEVRRSLHDDLRFYDLNSSPLYRLGMSNSFVSHVHPVTAADHRTSNDSSLLPPASSERLLSILQSDPIVTKLYQPIYELMKSVQHRPSSTA